MSKHYSKALYVLALAFGLILAPLVAAKPVVASSKAHIQEMKDKDVTVTGCLKQGDEEDEYMLTTEDGKTYALKSESVALKEHVGHKVTITGSLKKDEDADEDEAGELTVKTLKMVSDKCE